MMASMLVYYLFIIFMISLNFEHSSGYTEVLASSNTCWDAIDGDYALDYLFTAPYLGIISGVRLVANSGAQTCHAGGTLANWGCVNSNSRFSINLLQISANDTTADNAITLYPTADTDDVYDFGSYSNGNCPGITVGWYNMYSYSILDDEIILYSDTTTFQVSPGNGDAFILGWFEPICGGGSNNEGSNCATVYFLYSQIFDEPTGVPSNIPSATPTNKPTVAPSPSPTGFPTIGVLFNCQHF